MMMRYAVVYGIYGTLSTWWFGVDRGAGGRGGCEGGWMMMLLGLAGAMRGGAEGQRQGDPTEADGKAPVLVSVICGLVWFVCGS